MITLLLVDEPLVRRGLRMWLDRAADITVIGEASNEAVRNRYGSNDLSWVTRRASLARHLPGGEPTEYVR
jgi:DNA-binding NarL/FixJ family response regulator